MELAGSIASWSKDRSRGVGCVVVSEDKRILSTGYNGFPIGLDDNAEHRHERPGKYLYTEHAERNAIYSAGLHGVSLKGGTLYSTLFPCAGCARAIIQSGVKKLVTRKPHADSKWEIEFAAAKEMLIETDVEIEYVD